MTATHVIADLHLTEEPQVWVRIGDEVRLGDLHYLGLDPRSRDHECTDDVGLRRLIGGWLQTILAAEENQIFYLPFDFGDEITRWLACEKTGAEITVVFGRAEEEGWAFSPSDFQQQAHSLSGFQLDEPANPQTFYTARVLSNLRSCRAKIRVIS